MAWVTNRIYSFNDVVRACDNKKEKLEDNAKYPEWQNIIKRDNVLIIGGGESVVHHFDAIKSIIESKRMALVFASTRYASRFVNIDTSKYYILVGTESRRLVKQNIQLTNEDSIILPPYPRTMGTEIPNYLKDNTYELPSGILQKDWSDSCTAVAVKVAELLGKKIYVVGYDGYPRNILSEKEATLTKENRAIFGEIANARGGRLISLTPTLYEELELKSIYQYI